MKANYTYYCRNCDSDFITEQSLKFCPACSHESDKEDAPIEQKDKNFVIEIGTNLTLILILFLVFLWTKGCQ